MIHQERDVLPMRAFAMSTDSQTCRQARTTDTTVVSRAPTGVKTGRVERLPEMDIVECLWCWFAQEITYPFRCLLCDRGSYILA
jgi:hypothetical protein